MTRPWRIEFEGAYYHILSRGNDRKDIFSDNGDRVSFLNILGKMSDRFEVEVYAYVLMDNHCLCEASHNIITCYSRPINPIFPKACNGLAPLILVSTI